MEDALPMPTFSLTSIVIAVALPPSLIEGDPASCQLEVPSPSSLKNLLPPLSPVDLIPVPSVSTTVQVLSPRKKVVVPAVPVAESSAIPTASSYISELVTELGAKSAAVRTSAAIFAEVIVPSVISAVLSGALAAGLPIIAMIVYSLLLADFQNAHNCVRRSCGI